MIEGIGTSTNPINQEPVVIPPSDPILELTVQRLLRGVDLNYKPENPFQQMEFRMQVKAKIESIKNQVQKNQVFEGISSTIFRRAAKIAIKRLEEFK